MAYHIVLNYLVQYHMFVILYCIKGLGFLNPKP